MSAEPEVGTGRRAAVVSRVDAGRVSNPIVEQIRRLIRGRIAFQGRSTRSPSARRRPATPSGPGRTRVLVDTPDLGAALAGALGEDRFCHVQGHGIVSVASGIREATVGAAMLEQLAEATLTAANSGHQPRVITPDEIATLRGQVAGVEGRWACCCQRAGVTA
jgi:hypothetical protein